jgi:hypothetical protein
MTAKNITLRLQPDIYQMASTLAQRRHMSLNRLFQEGLDLLIAQVHEKQLFDDFSLIADTGTDELDVEFALAAQTQATPEQ